MFQRNKYYRNLILILFLILTGCSSEEPLVSYVPMSKEADMSDYMGISDQHCFRKINLYEMERMFEENSSGIFYVGHASCSYCQSICPYLNEAGLNANVTIYYLDVYDLDYPLYKDEYEEIYISLLGKTIREEDGEKTIYTPQVFTLVNGRVKDSMIAAKDWNLQDPTDKQIEKLKKKYSKMFEPFTD